MKSYFKFLSRNITYTLIEIFGLSVTLGFIILIASYAHTEFNVGGRLPESKEVYVVGGGGMAGMTYGTADAFFHNVPEIKSWTRAAAYGTENLMYGDEPYTANIMSLDTNFLQLFSYGLEGCDRRKILENENDVILSRSFAKKVFGSDDPVGRTLRSTDRTYTVTGVMDDFGPYDEFGRYDIFVSMRLEEARVQKMDNFGTIQTFLTLKEGATPDAVAEKLLDCYCEYWDDLYKRDNSGGAIFWGSTLTRFDKMYFSNLETYNPLRHGDRRQVEVLIIMALILLFSAVFNYINLTVAQTGKRAKEMATRRLLGESAGSVMRRYLLESFLFTCACFVLGAVLAVLCKGWFNSVLSADIVLTPDLSTALAALALIILISVISAVLPMLLISKFRPIDVVKGNYKLRSKMVFSKVFIILQNAISMVLIAVSLAMLLQMRHLVNLPMGYETKDMVVVYGIDMGWDYGTQQIIEERLKTLPCVEETGIFTNIPLASNNNGVHEEGDKLSWLSTSGMDSTAFRMHGFKVLERFGDPVDNTFWFTEEAARRYGITAEHPYIGDDEAHTRAKACGIIADYRTRDALEKPMDDSHNVVMNRNSGYAFGVVAKVSGEKSEVLAAFNDVWNKLSAERMGIQQPSNIFYVDNYLNDSLSGSRNTMKLMSAFMLMSILISALGLFAMSVYYTQQRSSEMALRKIFGSDIKGAAWKLSRSFTLMTAIAVVLSIPVCIYAINRYLSDFYNSISFPWIAVVAAGLITFLIAFASIIFRTWTSASRNPVDVLKVE